MPDQLERRMRLPPDAGSPARARRMLRDALRDAGLEEVGDGELTEIVLLLAGELCDNAVLHAGTAFEVDISVADGEVVVGVTDWGPSALEVHLASPRRGYGRDAGHGRGLLLVQRLAGSWGTRHDPGGRHRTWFSLELDAGAPHPAAPPAVAAAAPGPWPEADRIRWLLHIGTGLAHHLDGPALITELVRRLHELTGAPAVTVEIDRADGGGWTELACAGTEPDSAPGPATEIRLPLPAPLRGRLRIYPGSASGRADELAGLTAQRVALIVESDWLRGSDQRRRALLAYLADASELFGQSLDVDMTVAVVPQVVVPRLGQWCAVHLVGAGDLRLAALTHAVEDEVAELRTALDPTSANAAAGMTPDLRSRLRQLLRDGMNPAWLTTPTEGVAVPLTTRGHPLGVLTVGRPPGRPHSPEDIALISDIARRAALAIDNAQNAALHVATSQTLQRALLPRALPVAAGVDFAAAYVPESTGTEVGGDFYDVLPLGPGRWLASIGDVCGKGARAAARTGLVRDVLRVLVKDGRSLTEAVELLNDVMMEADDPTQFCTLAAARITTAGTATRPELAVDLVLAGHDQPVLVRADGTAELVGTHGMAAGLFDRVQVVCTTHVLGPGDILLAYTDGATERRRKRELFGPERLLLAATEADRRSAANLVADVRAVVEGFSDEPMRDDMALLAIRAVP
ncbi:SpoIIE family protein phosphatase [Pseudonocardia bannensis]|uniref:SpoIIE family protein phosphatase n=1 Tax=Pseudonocardia bannensis TaxID=630973 RepID=A0A848DJ21_9PSEU|nr:SpoIIE family protein phosphatase [Pseudonocardia bannensis]NMH92543.1 SpoIIE family protein phosphatase [Pseudonocardia bannensis]